MNTTDRQPFISLRNLSTGYSRHGGQRIVASGISATLRRGELTCVLGPNGAGKSTLLRTLAAFQPPAGGSVELDGRPLESYSERELARKVSVVLTERVTLSNLRVEELIGLGRSPYTGFWGRLSADDRRAVDDAIALVRIDDLRRRNAAALSDGELQKVMIAKSLAQQTPLIMLDEPTAFLDYPSKVDTMRLLHRLARRRDLTILLTTHDLELALRMADRVWLLDKELGLTEGTPEDLQLDGSVARYFAREGVAFDAAGGQFAIVSEAALTLGIAATPDCPPERFATLRGLIGRALSRNGMAAADAAAAGARILVGPTTLSVDGRPAPTIEALLSLIADQQIIHNA